MRLFAAFATLVFTVGCASPPPPTETPFDLTISPSSPAPGGDVTLTLTNNTAQPVGYNLCTSALNREVNDEWQPVSSDRVCTMELRTLEPGMSDSFTITLPADLETGVYRFQTNVENLAEGTRQQVATTVFLVSA